MGTMIWVSQPAHCASLHSVSEFCHTQRSKCRLGLTWLVMMQAKEMRSSTRMRAGDAPKKAAMAELAAARQQRDDRKSGKPEV